jgi:hypothetical protein
MRNVHLKHTLRDSAAEIEDGRLTIEAGGKATLLLTASEHQPLSESEPLCRIEFRGEGFEASGELKAPTVDALIDRLEAIRDGEVFDDD